MLVKFNGTITNEADLSRRVEQFARDANTPVQGAAEDFRDCLRAAVSRRLAKNHGLAASSRPAAAETFAGKVADAVKARLAQRSPRRVTQ